LSIVSCESARRIVARDPAPTALDQFARDVREGLLGRPKTLPCTYFYDDRGSRLFEQICDLPEYYLTRAEDSILRRSAEAMVAGWSRSPVLIELGSGSSTKTRRLISAARSRYGRVHYLPIDVSPTILAESAGSLVRDFPGLRVTGVAGDYRSSLSDLCARIRRPKLVLFLGSSLGNYDTPAAMELLRAIGEVLTPDDALLLGTDLLKEPARLESAYDDAAGVTAAFNKNLLVRINRELGGEFSLDAFDHEARFNAGLGRVEMHLVSRVRQRVEIPRANLSIAFEPGESIHTENSHKYDLRSLEHLARGANLIEDAAWTDERGDFRVQRWRRDPSGP
jgi:dimethylhistidine N-methyltransferase